MAQRTEFTTESRPRTPEIASHRGDTAHPRIDVVPPFCLTFHPERWMIMGNRLIPSLQRFPLADGVNGVAMSRGGKLDLTYALMKIEKEYRKIVPYEWAPDGVSYLQPVDTKPPNYTGLTETWITVFESADPGATETEADEEAYAAWCASLVDSGKLPRCTPRIARRMLEAAQDRLEREEQAVIKTGGHGAGVKRIKSLQRECEILGGYLAGAPTPTVRGKSPRAPVLE